MQGEEAPENCCEALFSALTIVQRNKPISASLMTSVISTSHTVPADKFSMDKDGPTDQTIVLVMGLTGAGKSFFINKLTGQNVEEGHKLKSCR